MTKIMWVAFPNIVPDFASALVEGYSKAICRLNIAIAVCTVAHVAQK
jgi:hypothetical protein